MKRLFALVLIALIALIYSACGASSGKSADMMPAATAAPSMSSGNSGLQSDSGMTTNENLPKNKKIIRNAHIDMEVESATKAYEALRSWINENGGYEYSSQTNKHSDYWTVTARLKIAPDHLDAFIEFARTQGELINCVVTSNDISEQYVDTQIRLDNAKKNLEKYYEFLEKAVDIDETLKVQNEINRITADIEAFEGRLKLWDSQIAESTVDLLIKEKRDPIKVKKEINWNAITFNDMLSLMRNGFIMTTNFLVSILQWVLIAVIALLPIGFIAGIVLLLRSRIRKNKKKTPLESKDKE